MESVNMWFYWASVCGSLNSLSGFMAFILGALTVALAVFYSFFKIDGNDTQTIVRLWRWSVTSFMVFSLGGAFIPTEKTMLTMVTLNATNEAFQTEIGQKGMRLIEQYLDEQLQELEK